MAKKDKEKKSKFESKSESKSESKPARKSTSFEDLRQHHSALPASTAPLPMTNGVNSRSAFLEPNAGKPAPFSLPIPTRIPRHLKSSPSYIAEQSLKRKRDAEDVGKDLDVFKRIKSKSPITESAGKKKGAG